MKELNISLLQAAKRVTTNVPNVVLSGAKI